MVTGIKIRSTDITEIMGKYFVSMWYCLDYSRRTQIFSLKSVWIASGIQDVWVESLKNFQLKCFRVDLKSCKRRQIRWVDTEVNSNWPDQNNKSLWSLYDSSDIHKNDIDWWRIVVHLQNDIEVDIFQVKFGQFL